MPARILANPATTTQNTVRKIFTALGGALERGNAQNSPMLATQFPSIPIDLGRDSGHYPPRSVSLDTRRTIELRIIDTINDRRTHHF